ncbi:MAG TPA: hypothetical protein VFK13_11285 [Gemmatimonadaceae bacterium]|nr:hypothetical protein [Gemmatimonadaceae bacterium]
MSTDEADLSAVRTVPIARRPNKVRAEEFASPPPPSTPAAPRSFAAFLDALPDVLVARDFRRVVDAIVDAAGERAVVAMIGGHVIKTGLAPVLLDLARRGVLTHVAMNGSAAIHDYEIARWGGTSEDVAGGLRDGTFGMAEETGHGMNEAFVRGARAGWGMGESLTRALDADTALAHPELSLLVGLPPLGCAVTVHAAIGAEIIHQHPAADGAALGATSHRDFRRLAAHLPALHDGGVVLNLGSAVILPEVFLKALTIARNLHAGTPTHFVTCDMDMVRHYRPRMNVVQRPTLHGGAGYEITGHHELMVPLLAWAVAERLDARGRDGTVRE